MADRGIQINKYLAHAGVSSRRQAEQLIKDGKVRVNSVIVREPGYRVKPNDSVMVNGETIATERKAYILLNKPKNVITTVADERGRTTVLDLLAGAPAVRLYPVGRLDRDTTGLLLITNDGELSQKLAHPRSCIPKTYCATLDKPVAAHDLVQLREGVRLEDGLASVDDSWYITPDKKTVGVALHSGKNRIVRRLFESRGYRVLKLDRVGFAGLTKKGLRLGQWRELTFEEVQALRAC